MYSTSDRNRSNRSLKKYMFHCILLAVGWKLDLLVVDGAVTKLPIVSASEPVLEERAIIFVGAVSDEPLLVLSLPEDTDASLKVEESVDAVSVATILLAYESFVKSLLESPGGKYHSRGRCSLYSLTSSTGYKLRTCIQLRVHQLRASPTPFSP